MIIIIIDIVIIKPIYYYHFCRSFRYAWKFWYLCATV